VPYGTLVCRGPLVENYWSGLILSYGYAINVDNAGITKERKSLNFKGNDIIALISYKARLSSLSIQKMLFTKG